MAPFKYETEPLDEAEKVVGVFYGGRGQVGQQFVVTNRRLLMGPLDTGIAQQIDAYLLNQAAPGGGDLLKSVLGKYGPMSPKTLWLSHVADVRATNGAGWFKAPGLEIRTDTEEVHKLGIVASPGTPSKSRKNEPARDRFVQVLADAARAAKDAPVKPPSAD